MLLSCRRSDRLDLGAATAFEASKYSDDLWISYTGKTLPQLNQEWRKAVAEEIAEAGRETVR